MRALRRLHPKTKRPARRGGDDGFTLIELLIVIVILPILMGGIAFALIAILQNEATTFNRVADSADAQLTSANFTRDVQSSTQVTTSSNLAAPNGRCWPTSSPIWTATLENASTPLLGLRWNETSTRTFTDGQLNGNNTISSPAQADFTSADDFSSVTDSDTPSLIPAGTIILSTNANGGTATSATLDNNTAKLVPPATDSITISLTRSWEATYWDVPIVSGPATTYELVRQFCQTGGGPPKFVSSSIVAHGLPSNQGTATITCNSSIPASQCTPTYLSGNWIPTAAVTDITLSASEPASGYHFNLSATPRDSGGGGQAVQALTITGGSSSLNEAGAGDTLTVNGGLDFNSSSGSIAGGASVNPKPLLLINPVPGQAPIDETSCSTTSCANVTSSFSATGTLTCVFYGGQGVCPQATSTGALTLPPIAAPGSPTAAETAGACTTTGSATKCTAGYYSAPPTIPPVASGNSTVTFGPGNYTFAGTSPVSIPNSNTSVVFDSGQYTFDNGFNVASTVTNVSLSSASGGVFFYFPGTGSLNVDTSGDSVQLSAATSGPYAGTLLYQPGSNGSALSIGGGGTTNALGGVVEASGAPVTLGLSGDTFTVGALIASNVTLGSSGSTGVLVTIGTSGS